MGMFDSVVAQCIKCRKEIEFQSKSGECDMLRFLISSCPSDIAEDINGETEICQVCSTPNKIVFDIPQRLEGRII